MTELMNNFLFSEYIYVYVIVSLIVYYLEVTNLIIK